MNNTNTYTELLNEDTPLLVTCEKCSPHSSFFCGECYGGMNPHATRTAQLKKLLELGRVSGLDIAVTHVKKVCCL